MGWRIENNILKTTSILEVKSENVTVKTFMFKDERFLKALPGQFLMLWVPSVDEIPLSVLDVDKNGIVSVAVKKVGEATRALHGMNTGETIGVRGPFGNSFSLNMGKILMVGGGTGIAPLLFLARKLSSKAKKIVFVAGAKTREELLFVEKLQELCGEKNVVITTEDGSYGIKCLATAPLKSLVVKERFDMIYTCGPEKMMQNVFNLAEKHGIRFEASLERLMRCAIGLCGSCILGKYRVCKDGPVFNANQLREVKNEFGILKRDFDGKKIPLE